MLPAPRESEGPMTQTAIPADAVPLLALVWLGGVVAAVAVAAVGQARFQRQARRGRAGPAVVGVFVPRLVVPADFRERYSAQERALIRLHERTHIERGDPRVNAVVALLQAVNWFNPLVHLAAQLVRTDQELACDADVLGPRPKARRGYAQALLKAHTQAGPPPLGCGWGRHPLEARIAAVAAGEPSEARQLAGLASAWALAALVGVLAWAAQPPRPADAPQPNPYGGAPLILVDINPAAGAPVVLPPRR
jgi:beta-lactamase regulating signal transducer with metallopeptidase domain